MCEKRIRKMKKGSHSTRLREARRMQRIYRAPSLSSSDDSQTSSCSLHVIDKYAQNRLLLELAWKTVALMHKNRVIQQKILDLQKETSEFVASIKNTPEDQEKYMEHIKLYGLVQKSQLAENERIRCEILELKMEPEE